MRKDNARRQWPLCKELELGLRRSRGPSCLVTAGDIVEEEFVSPGEGDHPDSAFGQIMGSDRVSMTKHRASPRRPQPADDGTFVCLISDLPEDAPPSGRLFKISGHPADGCFAELIVDHPRRDHE